MLSLYIILTVVYDRRGYVVAAALFYRCTVSWQWCITGMIVLIVSLFYRCTVSWRWCSCVVIDALRDDPIYDWITTPAVTQLGFNRYTRQCQRLAERWLNAGRTSLTWPSFKPAFSQHFTSAGTFVTSFWDDAPRDGMGNTRSAARSNKPHTTTCLETKTTHVNRSKLKKWAINFDLNQRRVLWGLTAHGGCKITGWFMRNRYFWFIFQLFSLFLSLCQIFMSEQTFGYWSSVCKFRFLSIIGFCGIVRSLTSSNIII